MCSAYIDITDRIIAMGLPADGFKSIYRNNRNDVIGFFRHFHSEHHKIYNLCISKSCQYPPTAFQNYSNEYCSHDHQPLLFEDSIKICRDIDEYLRKDPANVIAVHCKAGKGRTGQIICCYLLFSLSYK